MGDERVKEEALQIMGRFPSLPRLVVFDLDYTLWPFYCDCLSKTDTPYLFPHAPGILQALKDKGMEIAIASKSHTPDIAETFLHKLGIQSIFAAQEIYPTRTHKSQHFQIIHRKTGVPFESMLFFDDEYGNIDTVSKMGVTSVFVQNGVNLEELRLGLANFSRKTAPSRKESQT